MRDRLDNPDASNALFRNAEAVNALTRLRNNPILRKLELTDEIASKLKGAENLSFTQIIDNLENFARKTADNNVELKDFNKVLRQLTEGGGKSDGANWVITYYNRQNEMSKISKQNVQKKREATKLIESLFLMGF